MRRVHAGIYLAVVVATIAPDAQAGMPDIKAEVQAIYDQIGKAFEKKDIDGATKFFLPDATVKYGGNKELTLNEWKEQARKVWAGYKQTKARITVERVKLDADAVVATYADTYDIVAVDAKDGQEHKLVYQGKWRGTLKKSRDGWRLSRSVELERRVTRDGVLIDQWPRDKSKP